MANARNMTQLVGFFNKENDKYYMYKEGNDSKKSVMRAKIAVRESYKNKETGKYDYIYLPFKAFGASADFLAKYANNSDIIAISGQQKFDSNYEDSNGNLVYGTQYTMVDEVSIVSSASDKQGASNETKQAAPAVSAPKTGARAFLNRKKTA